MKLTPIHTGYFKLDGGAMFGVVPKVLWQKKIMPDENNLCNWAMRCLLIESGDRLFLIDTGMGEKQSDKFYSHYYRSETIPIKKAIENAGYSTSEVTDVFLTHLHFDHCGGAVEQQGEHLRLTFPEATYWSNQHHWDWATNPNPREKASFLTENILPIQESGQLKMVDINEKQPELPFDIIFVDGHTEKQMLPLIPYNGRKVVFLADLMPSTAHLGLAWVMGYDMRPLLTMKEKESFLNRAANDEWVLFYEHDAINEAAIVSKSEGRISLEDIGKLDNLL